MKLTRRQEQFIENLVDLTQEVDGPIHYSTLAERVGVSPFTAYDMLRVLEEKGMVVSEYHVSEGKTGPGRAERLFRPVMAEKPRMHFVEKFGDHVPNQEELKQFILEKARQGEFPDKELAEEVLGRIPPDGPEEIRYCLGFMMVIAMRLRRHEENQRFAGYFTDILPEDGMISPANLCLLGGFAYGILVQDETDDHEWSQMLLEHALQFQEIVRCMTPESCELLVTELKRVLAPLAEQNEQKGNQSS